MVCLKVLIHECANACFDVGKSQSATTAIGLGVSPVSLQPAFKIDSRDWNVDRHRSARSRSHAGAADCVDAVVSALYF